MSMNTDRMFAKDQQLAANSGVEFGDIAKLLIANNQTARIIGDFDSNYEHFVNTPKGQRPYYCGGPESDCPLCALATRYSSSDDEELQKIGKAIKAKEKFYFNVIDRSKDGAAYHKQSGKTYLLVQNQKGMNVGPQIFQGIAAVAKMRETQGGNSDPNTYDIMFTKTGSGINTNYGVQFTGVITDLTEEESNLELWPLSQIARVNTHEERQAAASFIAGEPVVADNVQQPAATPPAATPPVATPPAASVNPVASEPAVVNTAVPQVELKPAQWDDTYQNTAVQVEGTSTIPIPCSNDGCGATMYVDTQDTRQLKCHKCGTIYDSPAG